MKKNISFILCGILSAIVLHTCLQIEVWNYLAGGKILPNREGGKLRYAMGENENEWVMGESIQTESESLLVGHPLTEEEQVLFHEHNKRISRHNKVVFWSRGMGTLQYLLAPIAVFWSLILLSARERLRVRLFAALLSTTNALSIVLMLYRGYFND